MKNKLKDFYPFIRVFGQSSYYIYLMHPLVLTLMIRYAENNFLSVTDKIILYTFTVIPITVISCLAFTLIRNKFKKKKISSNKLKKDMRGISFIFHCLAFSYSCIAFNVSSSK